MEMETEHCNSILGSLIHRFDENTWVHPGAWVPFSLIGDGAQHDGVVAHVH